MSDAAAILHLLMDNIWQHLVQIMKAFVVYVVVPVVGGCLLWGRQDLINRLWLHIDRLFHFAVFCPSLSPREQFLRWACTRLPYIRFGDAHNLPKGIFIFWNDGSVLCNLLNTAIGGVCPGPHTHSKQPPVHAQELAEKYFGIKPCFLEEDFYEDFNPNMESPFVSFLLKLKYCIIQWELQSYRLSHGPKCMPVPVSKQCVVHGMGLFTAEIGLEACFYVYANNTTTKMNELSLSVWMRGPHGAHAYISHPFQSSGANSTTTNTNQQPPSSSSRSSIISIIWEPQRNRSQQAPPWYPWQAPQHRIDLSIELELERAKIIYVVESSGMYEIHLMSNGELLSGCPFHVHVTASNALMKPGSRNQHHFVPGPNGGETAAVAAVATADDDSDLPHIHTPPPASAQLLQCRGPCYLKTENCSSKQMQSCQRQTNDVDSGNCTTGDDASALDDENQSPDIENNEVSVNTSHTNDKPLPPSSTFDMDDSSGIMEPANFSSFICSSPYNDGDRLQRKRRQWAYSKCQSSISLLQRQHEQSAVYEAGERRLLPNFDVFCKWTSMPNLFRSHQQLFEAKRNFWERKIAQSQEDLIDIAGANNHISSLTTSIQSRDSALDNCSIISLEERKRTLITSFQSLCTTGGGGGGDATSKSTVAISVKSQFSESIQYFRRLEQTSQSQDYSMNT